MRGILENLPTAERTVTVLDMGASPEPFSRGTLAPVDVLLLVAEPYFKSLEVIGRLADLGAQLGVPRTAVVANKVRTGEQRDAIEAFCARGGLELIASLPFDDAIAGADLTGSAPLDANGQGSAGIDAIDELLTRL